MARKKAKKETNGGTGDLGFESQLWRAADALRSNMDAAEYKHVVLGLIFLKYIADSFESGRDDLRAELTKDGITGTRTSRANFPATTSAAASSRSSSRA
jgi:type I restriction enzyme M protein